MELSKINLDFVFSGMENLYIYIFLLKLSYTTTTTFCPKITSESHQPH